MLNDFCRLTLFIIIGVFILTNKIFSQVNYNNKLIEEVPCSEFWKKSFFKTLDGDIDTIIFKILYINDTKLDMKEIQSNNLDLRSENCFLELYFNNDPKNIFYSKSGLIKKQKTRFDVPGTGEKEYAWVSEVQFPIKILHYSKCELFGKVVKTYITAPIDSIGCPGISSEGEVIDKKIMSKDRKKLKEYQLFGLTAVAYCIVWFGLQSIENAPRKIPSSPNFPK